MSERNQVRELVEHLFRHRAGRILATLTRVLGLEHFDLAEEVVQDAMLQALRQWPFRGIPADPGAWLTHVASNRALDVIRRRTAFRRKLHQVETRLRAATGSGSPWIGPASPREVEDDQLAMMFICCHPAISAESRVALTLKTVSGFAVAEIARAFLVPEAAIAQRLVRAKRLIHDQGLALVLPPASELPARLDSVLQVIYLLFNEGYSAHHGEDLVRDDLCDEAIRLTHLLLQRPEAAPPKVHALMSLMLFQGSRLPARVDAAGDLLLLSEQDRRLWDQRAIQLGMHHLDLASEGEELTEYHLQAAIAAKHAVADTYEATDWAAVLALYEQLLELAPSPVVALNHAVALAIVEGPGAGLRAIEAIRHDASMKSYYLLPATRADLLLRLGRLPEAAQCYREALTDQCTEPERRFLLKRLATCEAPPAL